MRELFSGFKTLAFLTAAEELHPQKFAQMKQKAEELADQYRLDKKMYKKSYRQIHKRCGSFRQVIANIKNNTSNVSVLPEKILRRTAEYTVKHEFVTNFEHEGHQMRACGCFEAQVSPNYQFSLVNYRLLLGRELFHLFYTSFSNDVFEVEKEQPEEFKRLSADSERLAEIYQHEPLKFLWDLCSFYRRCSKFQRTIVSAHKSINQVDFNYVLRKLTAEFKTRHEFITTYQSSLDKSKTIRKRQHRACGCTDWLEEIKECIAREELFERYGDQWLMPYIEEDQPKEFAQIRLRSTELYEMYQVDHRRFKEDLKYLMIHCSEFVKFRQKLESQETKEYRKYRFMKLVAEFRARHEFVTNYSCNAHRLSPGETPDFKRGCGCWSKD